MRAALLGGVRYFLGAIDIDSLAQLLFVGALLNARDAGRVNNGLRLYLIDQRGSSSDMC